MKSTNTLLLPDRQFLSREELHDMGYSNYKLRKLVDNGTLIKRTNKAFEIASYQGDRSMFSAVAAYVPNGVFCMMTAARYYGLLSYVPDVMDIAIEKSAKVSTLPEFPRIRIWYFSGNRFTQGVSVVSDSVGEYEMYDMEKTVADIIHYRNKIGMKRTKEILRKYLEKSDRSISLLQRYAGILGCGKVLRNYLDVLL